MVVGDEDVAIPIDRHRARQIKPSERRRATVAKESFLPFGAGHQLRRSTQFNNNV